MLCSHVRHKAADFVAPEEDETKSCMMETVYCHRIRLGAFSNMTTLLHRIAVAATADQEAALRPPTTTTG